jgi:hypothetical protein
MAQGENLLDNDCPYCLLRREIIAVRFSLLRPPAAVFVYPCCCSAVADDDGPRKNLPASTGAHWRGNKPMAPARV